MYRKIRKFAQLEAGKKWLFIEAYARLALMRAAILTLPFKRLVRSLDQHNGAVAPGLDSRQMAIALDIGEAVRYAAGNTPWESACLAQVLTAQRMLSRRRIGGIFHLGAAIDGTADERLKAHAWLICGGRILTGEAGHEAYKVLTTYRWK